MGRPYQFIYYCPSEIDHQPETIETYPDSLELSNIAQIISGSMSRETIETYPDSLELSNLAQIISGSISSSLSRPKKNITKLYLEKFKSQISSTYI